jgi:uncharacterized damage-inducible protein DinB
MGNRATSDVHRANTGRILHQAMLLFFRSIHGTLNHLLLTDSTIWYPRFTKTRSASLPLDAELESNRTDQTSRLIAAIARWPEYVASLDEPALADDLRYTMTTGKARVLPTSAALLHIFNHATNHWGQITAAISLLGFAYQPLDLPFLIFSNRLVSDDREVGTQ